MNKWKIIYICICINKIQANRASKHHDTYSGKRYLGITVRSPDIIDQHHYYYCYCYYYFHNICNHYWSNNGLIIMPCPPVPARIIHKAMIVDKKHNQCKELFGNSFIFVVFGWREISSTLLPSDLPSNTVVFDKNVLSQLYGPVIVTVHRTHETVLHLPTLLISKWQMSLK